MDVDEFMDRGLLSSDEEIGKMDDIEEDDQNEVEDDDEELEEDDDDDDDDDEQEEEGMDDGEDDDDRDEAAPQAGHKVTSAMVRAWSEMLQDKNSLKALRQVVDAVGAAIHHIAEIKSTEKYHYFIENAQVFNALVRCCLRHVHNVIQHHVPYEREEGASSKKKSSPSAHKGWSRLRKIVKAYGTGLLLMLQHLHSPTLRCAVLRQTQHLLAYLSCFPRLLRLLTKRLTTLWSSGDEHVRVLAFLCLRQLVLSNNNATFKENCFKQMYLSFARNCAFTSISTLAGIQFMQNSLVEIYSLDLPMTYQHGFIYIRQLAIQLRKAMTDKSKANLQAVYNWQFVHSICLWCRVLADCCCTVLDPLIFPLVQVIIGTVQLLPTARCFPLRFHCLRALIRLSSKTDVYIPVASHLLEVLDSSSVHCRTKGSIAKPPNFSVILKVSKSQLQTRSYQDGLIDNVFDLLLDHLSSYSHHIAFPELVLPVLLKVKAFCKKTKVPKFQQQMRQLVTKIEEVSTATVANRSTVSFSPKDSAEVATWMTKQRQKGTSLQKFYSSWKELHSRQSAAVHVVGASKHHGEEQMDDGSSDEEAEVQPKKRVGRKRRHPASGEGSKQKKPMRKQKHSR